MGFPTRITSVDGQTGTVDLTKADVGLANVDNTSDANKPVSTAQLTAIQARSNAVISTTWANRATAIAAIAALTPGEGYVRVTDIGKPHSLWWCDGVKLSVNGIIDFPPLGVGIILPSLVAANVATYSQVGTTITVNNTVGHAIPATTLDGNSVYLTPSTGTLVEGVFTNFQRTGANTFTCESAISQTINGFLASTTGIKTLANFTIPGNLLGLNGRIELKVSTHLLNSGGAKTLTATFGGTSFFFVNAPNNGRDVLIIGIRNKNATNRQQAVCNDSGTGISASTGTLTTAAIDTTADVVVSLKATVAVANEWMCLEHSSFTVYPD